MDPKGYLTSLDSVVIKSEAEIGDIKRARMLFDSLVKSNPKHAPGWIAAACLEEHAGRMVAARKLIKAGCEQCPKSEDVWLEAARLHVRARSRASLVWVLMLVTEPRGRENYSCQCRPTRWAKCQDMACRRRSGTRRESEKTCAPKRCVCYPRPWTSLTVV